MEDNNKSVTEIEVLLKIAEQLRIANLLKAKELGILPNISFEDIMTTVSIPTNASLTNEMYKSL